MKEKVSKLTYSITIEYCTVIEALLRDNATYNKWQGIKYNVQKIHGIQLKGIIPNK